jgi:hypothetical protein
MIWRSRLRSGTRTGRAAGAGGCAGGALANGKLSIMDRSGGLYRRRQWARYRPQGTLALVRKSLTSSPFRGGPVRPI